MKILKGFLILLLAIIAASGPAETAAQVVSPSACGLTSLASLPGSVPRGLAGGMQTVRCLQASRKLPATGARASGGQFITFDPPGSTFTVPSGISPDGEIVGYYGDSSGVQHGFVRSPRGGFTTIDPPGATFTQPSAVTPAGDVAGTYCDTASCARIHGFVRALGGSFTTFDAPGSSSSLIAGLYDLGGPPPSINPAGSIAGSYFDASFTEHGFVRSRNGAWTTVDVPGSPLTEVLAINPSGVVVGDYCDLINCFVGFLRTPDGRLTTIDAPASCDGESIPIGGINAAGVVAGQVCGKDGYVRAANGAMTLFDPPGSLNTEPIAINSAGTIAGWFFTDTAHGYVRNPDGAITTFDPAGSTITVPVGIGATGAIIGLFADSSGAVHGFLRLP